MSLQNQLESADLEKLRKELDARAEALTAKERLLDPIAKQNELKLLDNQIKAKGAILAALEENTIAAQSQLKAQLKTLEDEYNVRSRALRGEFDALNERYEVIKTKREAAAKSLREQEGKLKIVKAELAERKEYLATQEQLIADTTDEWNGHLLDLKLSVEQVQSQKDNLMRDILELTQERTALADEIVLTEERLALIGEKYDQARDEYKHDLDKINRLVADKKIEYNQMLQDYKAKTQELDARTKSIELKEGALMKQHLDLQGRERLLKSNYAVLGIPPPIE